ncbi:MAG: serine hydrolase [Polyangiales bacterium]
MRRVLALLVFASLLGACGSSSPPSNEVWPTDVWARAAPETQGFDSAMLASLVQAISDTGTPMHSLSIVRRGVVILDVRFFPWIEDRPHDVASCTKSLTSTGVGLALRDGTIPSLDARLLSFFPERTIANGSDEKQAISLRDALTMRAGFQCIADPAELTLFAMTQSPDYVQFALDLPMQTAPGTEWVYCSPVPHLLSAVVGGVAGEPLDAYLGERLFAPLGITDVVWPRDPQGVSHGWGDVRMRPLDLARIGLLFARGGRWRDGRLLSESWVEAALSDQTSTGYGYLWWVDPEAFSARGRGGQYLYVIPSKDLILVTTASAGPEDEARFSALLAGFLLPALKSDSALPPNPDAVSSLDERIALAAQPPPAVVPTPTPSVGVAIDGKAFALASNLVGWDAITLSFAGAQGTLTIEVGGVVSTVPFGLDGVARFGHAAKFAATGSLDDVDVALVGTWLDDHTLELRFDTLDRIDAGTITLTIDADASGLSFDLYERTFLRSHVVVRGTPRP